MSTDNVTETTADSADAALLIEDGELELEDTDEVERLKHSLGSTFKMLVFRLASDSDRAPPTAENAVFTCKLIVEIFDRCSVDVFALCAFVGFLVTQDLRGTKLHVLYKSEFDDAIAFYKQLKPTDEKLISTMVTKAETDILKERVQLLRPLALAKCIAQVRCGDTGFTTLLHSILANEHGSEKVYELTRSGDASTVLEAAGACEFAKFTEAVCTEPPLGDMQLYQKLDTLVDCHIHNLAGITYLQNETRGRGIGTALMRLMFKSHTIYNDLDALADTPCPASDASGQQQDDMVEVGASSIQAAASTNDIPKSGDLQFRFASYLTEIYLFLRAKSLLMNGLWWPLFMNVEEPLMDYVFDEAYMRRAYLIAQLTLFNSETWEAFLSHCVALTKPWQTFVYFHALSLGLLSIDSEASSTVMERIKTLLHSHRPTFDGTVEPDFSDKESLSDVTKRLYIAIQAAKLLICVPDSTIDAIYMKNNVERHYKKWVVYQTKHAIVIQSYLDTVAKLEATAVQESQVESTEPAPLPTPQQRSFEEFD